MSISFRPNRAYQSQLDIRFAMGTPDWALPIVEGAPPSSICTLVVMGRRGGKTWLAQAIATARGTAPTTVVDLRSRRDLIIQAGLGCLVGRRSRTHRAVPSGVVLVDEPGLVLNGAATDRGLRQLVRGLEALREAGTVPVVFATPGEYSVFIDRLPVDAAKDVRIPDPLSEEEIARMTSRAPVWAPQVVERVRQDDASWLGTPFLLESLLQVAEDLPGLRTDSGALQREVCARARDHDYVDQVFRNGLSDAQRSHLRRSRWCTSGVQMPTVPGASDKAMDLLCRDPILTHHLPEPLRIHHICDLHIGGALRENVDAKDRTVAGQGLAAVAGAGNPLDRYLDHLRHLHAHGQAPHLVVITGDVVERPDDALGTQAIDWIAEVRSTLADHADLGPDDPRVVLVGGNHDVSWDLASHPSPLERHQWFARTFADCPHPDLHLPAGPGRRLEVRYPRAGLRLILLGSAESGGELRERLDELASEELREQFVQAADPSAVIRAYERIDPGVVSRAMLDQLAHEEGSIAIAAIHHPLSPVPSVEVAPYAGVVNAGQVKHVLAKAGVALVLHGHTHQAFLAAERFIDPDGPSAPGRHWTMRIAGAATLAARSSDEQNGYNQIFVHREEGEHVILLRPMRLEAGQWQPRQSLVFRPGAPGDGSTDSLLKQGVQREVFEARAAAGNGAT